MFPTSFIELSQSAFHKNIKFLRRQIGKGVRLELVVKGNAYGHGLNPFLPLAEQLGVNHFSTFNAEEAYQAWLIKKPLSTLTIMGDVGENALPWAIENNICFNIFDFEQMVLVKEMALRVGKPARVHLELETGMNRLGLEESNLENWAQFLLESNEAFVVEGTCTHLAGAENIANHVRVTSQIATFHRLCANLERLGLKTGRKHVSSSAGIFCYPEAILDQVRIGISAYGFWPTQEVKMRYIVQQGQEGKKRINSPLHRVLSWKSRIMTLKNVSPGEFIGYGTSFLTSHAMRIAVIPVGYRDGFARNLSNRGRVLVGGRSCCVVGTVNMNMAIVDVTSLPNAAIGDEVVLIGQQGRSEISVSSFSNIADDLNYEILVRLPADIPRKIVP